VFFSDARRRSATTTRSTPRTAQSAQHDDGDREPERDDPNPRGRDADERHADPQQPVREPEDERLGLGVAAMNAQ